MSETRICANCGAEHSIEDMYQVKCDAIIKVDMER